jgi:hypothetical protein
MQHPCADWNLVFTLGRYPLHNPVAASFVDVCGLHVVCCCYFGVAAMTAADEVVCENLHYDYIRARRWIIRIFQVHC